MQNRSTIIIFTISIVCVVLVAILVWGLHVTLPSEQQQRSTPETDSISGATMSMSANSSKIPENPDYEVLGNIEGLKGVIIRYDEQLYRGGDIVSKKGMERLKKHGIQTIIAVTPTSQQRSWADSLEIEYREVSFDYNEIPNNLQLVFENIFKTSPSPFYVHCHGGTTRAGALCMLYRMKIQSWSFERSLIEFGRLGGDLAKSHSLTESLILPSSENKNTGIGKGGT